MLEEKKPHERPQFIDIYESLQKILVDISISDEKGKQFWLKNWPNCTHVPYIIFIEKLLKYLEMKKILKRFFGKKEDDRGNINDPMKNILHYFKSIVSHGDDADIEKFGKVLEWFGPLQENESVNIFNNIEELLKCDWFFGILSGKEAKAIMKKEIQKKKKGTFLVRCNDRLDYKNYPFIVSVVTGKPQSKSIIHYKILLEIKEEKKTLYCQKWIT